jgi:methyltransferase (TIGR00027 family)
MTPTPDSTAVRVALWRALHVEVDPGPHVLEDVIGLELAAPAEGWRGRLDMHPDWTRSFRLAIVARARYVEDLVAEEAARGVLQYVILGAGLDTFAQRRSELASRLHVFEVDRPAPQEWKRRRLLDLGYAIPDRLHFVPVDFEAGDSWWARLVGAGFDPAEPAVVSCAGVTMYLTREAVVDMLRQLAKLAPGSTLAMTFIPPVELIDAEERAGIEMAIRGASAAGTPFLSFFTPDEMSELARDVGFREARHVSGADLAQHYFAVGTEQRPSKAEEMLVART